MIERRVSIAITEEQIEHVARLSKLSSSEGELVDFTNQLNKIIDTVELLEEVDTIGAPSTLNVNRSVSVICKGVATPGMDRKELVRNVPESENGYTKVPAIMNNGEAGA